MLHKGLGFLLSSLDFHQNKHPLAARPGREHKRCEQPHRRGNRHLAFTHHTPFSHQEGLPRSPPGQRPGAFCSPRRRPCTFLTRGEGVLSPSPRSPPERGVKGSESSRRGNTRASAGIKHGDSKRGQLRYLGDNPTTPSRGRIPGRFPAKFLLFWPINHRLRRQVASGRHKAPAGRGSAGEQPPIDAPGNATLARLAPSQPGRRFLWRSLARLWNLSLRLKARQTDVPTWLNRASEKRSWGMRQLRRQLLSLPS